MSAVGKFWDWLFGSSSVAQTATAIGDAVDKNTTTDAEAGALDNAERAQVQAFAAPGAVGGALGQVINAFNSAVRPFLTLRLTLGITGDWKLPSVEHVDPFWQTAFVIVLTFWFGGRMIVKDLPQVIGMILALRARLRKV